MLQAKQYQLKIKKMEQPKKQLFSILFFLAIVFSAYGITPETTTHYVTVFPSLQYTDESKEEEPEHGHRLPPRGIECKIDAIDGVVFYTEEQPYIISYEICDTNGSCISVSTNESDFINELFDLTGEFQIVFRTDSFDYSGYIYLHNAGV